MNTLRSADYVVFLIYFLTVAGYGYWIYTKKRAAAVSSTDYFLAEGALTWWAIGASLIASNISAEQMIGMSGSGFKMRSCDATSAAMCTRPRLPKEWGRRNTMKPARA
jgi:solute:Na+ symporter, SSS family